MCYFLAPWPQLLWRCNMDCKRRVVLVGLLVALMYLVACQKKFTGQGPGAGHHYGQEKNREFQVYIYADSNNPGQCLADWPVGTLWRTKGHTVTWFSVDGGQYTVDFTQGSHTPDKSPFQ